MERKKNTFFCNIRTYFREYCNCASVHGFRYFGEKRTVFEKIWWLIVFISSLAACVFAIYTVYKKWEQSPVIVSLANRGTPIYEIPFPAVTICSESKSSQEKFNYTEIMQKKIANINLTESEDNLFEYMSLVCDYKPALISYGNLSSVPDDFFEVIDMVKPMFQIQECYYRGKPMECKKIFISIITDEGVCYTFNMLDRIEIFRENVVHYSDFHQFNRNSTKWSLESGYKTDAGLLPYPRRALLAGMKYGLRFKIVTKKKDLDYACKDSFQGYRVVVNTPTAIPLPSKQYFRIPLDQSILGAIHPSMITTSDSVKVYDKNRRRCYFQSERFLKYFKIYNLDNCYLECLTNYTLNWCDCVSFHMPRENGTRICGSANIECMDQAERQMQMRTLKRKLLKRRTTKQSRIYCDCLPVCADLSYDIETSQTDWDSSKSFRAFGREENNETHWSSLNIFFKSDNFITSQRNELYGPIDFLANFGGLLGLFTGFSILSLMEIIYFLTVRLICNKRLYGQWTGHEIC